MTLANCRRCGSLYQRISSDLCQKCYQEEEIQIRAIRAYQRKNPSATAMDIIKTIDVDPELLEKWIADDRVHLEEHEDIEPRCRECGSEVVPGEKLCRNCMYKKIASTNRESTSPVKTGTRGMYIKRSR